MNDVAELKQFVVVHARAQNIPHYRELLDRIRTDDEDAPGSWVHEWSRAAEAYTARGDLLAACRHYNMARFPYVDGPARQVALDECVAAFDRWRTAGKDTGIERLDLDLGLGGGKAAAWAAGLSSPDSSGHNGASRRPLLLVMGGIVTIKEQWAAVLTALRRWGMAVVVTELPGVGENSLGYTPESWRMISAILDALADRADVAETYALALSFSGHLALRCAVEDRRIRGVVTTNAPIREFFLDADWLRQVPRITLDTLGHLTSTKPDEIPGSLDDWALTGEQLAALEIPVHYMVSRRDEIIPPGEADLLRRHVRDLHLLELDDVHASPAHTVESRLWTGLSVLQQSGRLPVQRTLLRGVHALISARRRATVSRASVPAGSNT